MIQLHLLGGLDLRAPDGSPILSVLAQPRRAGMLAYLAAANPRGFHSRDKLLALFWPESDAEHARNALRQSLHFLRRSLGEAAIVGRGEEVAANPDLFECDVVVLDQAMDQRDWGKVVRLYRGPFLEGFHMSGAPAFDRWLEEERDRVRACALKAGEELSGEREATGDLAGAVEAARWSLHWSPASGRTAMRLIELLGRRGDRSGAIRAYDSFKARLAEDYGLEPSGEVEATVEAVRRGRPLAAEQKPSITESEPVQQPPIPQSEPQDAHRKHRSSHPGLTLPRILLTLVSIVVALGLFGVSKMCVDPPRKHILLRDFADTRPDTLAGTLADDLRREIHLLLDGSPSLQPVQPDRSPGTWDYLLEASIDSDSVIFTLSPYLPLEALGRWAFQVSGTGSLSGRRTIAASLTQLVEERVMGRSSLEPGLRGTTHVAAAEAYSRGRGLWDRRWPDHFDHALALFREAVAQDPDFALAYAAIADVYNLLGAYDYGRYPPSMARDSAREAATRAVELGPELAEARTALATTHFFYDWDFERAEEGYQFAIELDGGYAHAHHYLGLLYAAQGRFEEALDQLNQALESDSSPVLRAARARIRYFKRDYREASQEYEAVLEENVDFTPALLGGGLSALMNGDLGAARRDYQLAENILPGPAPVVWALQGHLFGKMGDTQGALEMLGRLDYARQEPGVYIPPEYMAMVHLGLGNLDQALTFLEEAFESGSNSMTILAVDPLMEPLRDHPRYLALLERIKIRGEPGGDG